jgi:DNA-binding phage protein
MAEFIETKEDVIAHLSVALEENDTDFLLSVLNALARRNHYQELEHYAEP